MGTSWRQGRRRGHIGHGKRSDKVIDVRVGSGILAADVIVVARAIGEIGESLGMRGGVGRGKCISHCSVESVGRSRVAASSGFRGSQGESGLGGVSGESAGRRRVGSYRRRGV